MKIRNGDLFFNDHPAAERSSLPKRILMTADTIGGVWTYALELIRALEPCGIEFALATMGAPLSRAQRSEARTIRNLTIYPSRFKLEWMEEPWREVAKAGEWLLRLEAKTQPDLIHLNGFSHGALPWSRPVLIVGHSCVLSWWKGVRGAEAPAKWDRYHGEVSSGLRAADWVIAPTRAMMAALQRYYGPLLKASVVPNGRNPFSFAPGRKEPFILTAGRLWDEAKNVTLLEAVAGRLPWPIYVAGETKHPDGMEIRYKKMRSLGRLAPAELSDRLAHATIYALPARYEPFGLSVLEAGLSGCALVLGDIPSLRELWDGAALFVPPDDPEALYEALHRLIPVSPFREEQASAARARALTLTAKRMAEGYLHVYRALTRRPVPTLVER
jgi:glycosyltransferase involved in cell wall biosynthesis